MPKSIAFIRIKQYVLDVVRAIPVGRVTSYRAIGGFLNVVPRHVAYILATLTAEERLTVPWHRVVGDDGALGKPRHDAAGHEQAELLAAEGVAVDARRRVVAFAEHFYPLAEETTGVVPLDRYDLPEG